MAHLIRTISLPINDAADWTSFAWPSKDPADTLPHVVDATDWLNNLGLSVSGTVAVTATAGLLVGVQGVSLAGVITLSIGGGNPSTTATVSLSIPLSSGYELAVNVALPIRAGVSGTVPTTPPTPSSAISHTYTVSGAAISPTDAYALVQSTGAIALSLPPGLGEGHAITVANFGPGTLTLTIASLLGQAGVVETMPAAAVLNLFWSVVLDTYLYAS